MSEEETEGEYVEPIQRKLLKFREYEIYDYDDIEKEEELIRKKEDDLYEACIKGELNRVKNLVAKGYNVNEPDVDGETAIHYAAKANHLEVMKFLISQKADVNAKGLYQKAPVHYVCENGNFRALQLLVDANVDITVITRFRENCLHFVCRNGNIRICEYLLSRNIINPSETDVFKRTPLHYCSEMGHTELVKAVLLQMERIEREKTKSSVVFTGYKRRGPAVVETLKDWEMKDIEQLTPMDISDDKTLFGRIDIFEFNMLVNETGELSKIRQEVEMYNSLCKEIKKEIRETGRRK